MAHIGIVAGCHTKEASQIKACIYAADASAVVCLDDEIIRAGADVSERMLHVSDAIERLRAKGMTVIGFACAGPHEFMSELQDETDVVLVDCVNENAEVKSAQDYAQELLGYADKRGPHSFRIGIIGGLGPMASVDLYEKITRLTPAKTDQEHFKVVLDQNPQTPDRTACLLTGGKNPTLALYRSGKRLQDAGADLLIVGCNTAHAFLGAVAQRLTIPFVDMQIATLEEVRQKLGDQARIGLLATTGTIQTGIYTDKAKAMDLPLFVPDESHQAMVMDSIYGPQGVKAGLTTGKCRDELMEAAQCLVERSDCNVLVLGCTELPLILDEGTMNIAGREVFVIDPTMALARKVVAIGLETVRGTGRL